MQSFPKQLKSNVLQPVNDKLPDCRIEYSTTDEMVMLEIGHVAIKLKAESFLLMHELMRKAAAKMIMKTDLKH